MTIVEFNEMLKFGSQQIDGVTIGIGYRKPRSPILIKYNLSEKIFYLYGKETTIQECYREVISKRREDKLNKILNEK